MESIIHIVHETISKYPDSVVQYTIYGLLSLFIIIQNFQHGDLAARVAKVERYYVSQHEFKKFETFVDDIQEKVLKIQESNTLKIEMLHSVGTKIDSLNDFVRNRVILADEKSDGYEER